MLMEQTLQTLNALRLPGMASAFAEQQTSAAAMDLSFDERFAMLVDRELIWRENRRVTRLLREAKLKSSQACLEDVRYGGGRKLDKALMAQLGSCQWIRAHQNLILTGATGCGKTWLACALGNAACRQGLSVVYVRTPRLFEELRIAQPLVDGAEPGPPEAVGIGRAALARLGGGELARLHLPSALLFVQ